MKKLYVVTRRDLSPGYQLAQSCHAMRQWSEEQPELDREWFHNSNYIVCLSVENLAELLKLVEDALHEDIVTTWFREPDLDDEITAVVLAPTEQSRSFCSGLPLTLRGVVDPQGEVPDGRRKTNMGSV